MCIQVAMINLDIFIDPDAFDSYFYMKNIYRLGCMAQNYEHSQG